MAALVEFHDEANLPRVLDSGADLVGINNRDLHRFVTDLDLTLRLRDQIPARRRRSSARAASAPAPTSRRLEAAGVSAILVGETLMRAHPTSAWPSSNSSASARTRCLAFGERLFGRCLF